MKINHKIIMVSVAAMMGISSFASATAFVNNKSVVCAATAVYQTVGKNKVKIIKNTNFVNTQGTKQSLGAEKGGSYTIYAIKNINNMAYLSVQKSNKYWLPASAVKGTVTYDKNGFTYTITADDKKVSTIKPHATSVSGMRSITLSSNAYVYNSNGKRINNGLGKYFISKGTQLSCYGTKRINGKKYVNIGNGQYIKAGNIQKSSSANVASKSNSVKASLAMPRGKNTIALKNLAYAYTAKGKRMNNYLGYNYIKKGTVLNYYGTKKISGKTFYYIGDNAYVNGVNVGKVTNK